MEIGSLLGRLELQDFATSVLQKFTTDLSKAGDKLDAFGQNASRAGGALSVGITAPLVAAAGASSLFSANFEASMTRLSSLAGVAEKDIGKVKDRILEMAPAVGIGPQALADAMTKISSTVEGADNALAILEIAAKGSAAGMGEAVDVAGALTAVINSYGEKNISAAQAADVLTKAVQDGGAEAKELAPTLANVVPLAAQLGIKFTEVGANIATFTKLGVPAAEAVTSLSAVMTALLKETNQGAAALDSIGMSYDDLRAAIKERGLAATLADLTTKFGDNKTLLTDVFGRIEGLRNVMGTAGQQAETYTKEIAAMNDAYEKGGNLQAAFDAMQGKQVKTWGELSALVQVAAIKFGDVLAPAIGSAVAAAKPLLDGVIKLVGWFGDLPQPLQTVAIAIAAVVAAVGPLLMVIGSISTGLAAIIPILPAAATLTTALGTAFTILTGPIGLTVAGLGALYLVLDHFGAVDWIINFFTMLGQKIGLLNEEIIDLTGPTVQAAKGMKDWGQGMQQATAPSLDTVNKLLDDYSTGLGTAKVHVKALTDEEKRKKKQMEELNAEIAAGRREIGHLSTTQKDLIVSYDAMGLSIDKVSLKTGVSELAIKAFKDELKATDQALQDNVDRMKAVEEEAGKFQQSFAPIKLVREDVTLLKSTWNEFHDGMTVAGDTMTRVVIPSFSELPNVASQTADKIKEVGDNTSKSTFELDKLAKAFAQLADIAGGSFGGVVKGIATVIGSMNVGTKAAEGLKGALASRDFTGIAVGAAGMVGAMDEATKSTSRLHATIGGAATGAKMGSVFGPYGAAIGGVAGALVGFFRSAGAAERAINPLREAFVQLNGGLGALNERAVAAGTNLNAMLNARNPEQYKKAIDELNATFKLQDDAMAELDATAEKYGITLSEMGPKYAQGKLDEQFLQLYRDQEILKAGGVEFDTILMKQAESYQGVITQALLTGSTIPAAMKPAIARMVELGLLTDESGNKLEDLEGLTFAETLDKKFESLITTIGKLADAIAGRLGTAINNIPTSVNIDVNIQPHVGEVRGPSEYASTGGRVTRNGVQYLVGGGSVLTGPWAPRGTDTVPVMMAPGEGVVTSSGMRRLGDAGLSAINSGRGFGGSDDSAAIDRLSRNLHRYIMDQPNAIARAVRDEVQKVARHG